MSFFCNLVKPLFDRSDLRRQHISALRYGFHRFDKRPALVKPCCWYTEVPWLAQTTVRVLHWQQGAHSVRCPQFRTLSTSESCHRYSVQYSDVPDGQTPPSTPAPAERACLILCLGGFHLHINGMLRFLHTGKERLHVGEAALQMRGVPPAPVRCKRQRVLPSRSGRYGF